MDKYEYRVRAEEIKALIEQKEYIQAAEIADTIDWSRVKSVMMLCMISDLYKINRRFEDAREVLLMAYERHPGGRSICYSLCELSIKMGDVVQAVEYYKEFVQVAPRDTGRYILQYKLYEAQDVSIEERIAVLEELKKRDYREKWAYELAYLYHRIGLATRCVEECDELILWFGAGKYVIKAMELKMLHAPLTPQQQSKYDNRFRKEAETYEEPAGEGEETPEIPIEVRPAGQEEYPEQEAYAGQEEYSEQEAYAGQEEYPEQETYAGQEEYSEQEAYAGQEEYLEQEAYAGQEEYPEQEAYVAQGEYPGGEYEKTEDVLTAKTQVYGDQYVKAVEEALAQEKDAPPVPEGGEELDIQVKTVDVSQYNTLNLQKELAEGLKEVLGEDELLSGAEEGIYGAPIPEDTAPEEAAAGEVIPDGVEEAMLDGTEEAMSGEAWEAAAGEAAPDTGETMPDWTGEAGDISGGTSDGDGAAQREPESEVFFGETGELEEVEEFIPEEEEQEEYYGEEDNVREIREWVVVRPGEPVQEELPPEEELPEELAEMLSVEPGGQIRLVVPEDERIEKQITGQLTIEEVLAEWEKGKQDMPDGDGEDDFEEYDEIEDLAEEALEEVLDIPPQKEVAEPEGGYLDDDDEETGEAEEEESGSGEAKETKETEGPEDSEEAKGSKEPEPGDQEEAGAGEASGEKKEAGAGEASGEKKDAPEDGEQPEDAEKSRKGADGSVVRDKAHIRSLTREEKELFGAFLQNKTDREKLVRTLDTVSLAAYTGNVIVTGDEGMDTFGMAKNIIRDVQMSDPNFSGKTAKISGDALNEENVSQILEQLSNGALIIQKASGMNQKTVDEMYRCLQRESFGIIVVLEDSRRSMNKFLGQQKKLSECFNARMDLEALDDQVLVAFSRKYAREQEFSIDELGVLALHTRIQEMQSSDHAVTIMEVKSIVDDAIRRARRKSVRHFCDILLAKRYDDEDMIILREKDFTF